ncbi:MAG TPA: HdeD family acid-resistance protein [Candidatus Eisenbacteria bacterium]|nr:HdeD family acid-resistance protein [Candidatus Eisenbacteria bacterium]
MPIAGVDLEMLVRNWWAVVLRGVAGILFGVFTFVAPGISLAALVLLFGAYAFADGTFAIVAAVRRRGETDRWWVLLIEGIVGIGAGLVTLASPGLTAIALLYVIAAWALVTGVFEIAAAIRLRKVITGEWLLALSGVASIALGALLMAYPGAGALAVVFWIGAYAFVAGTALVVLGFKLRARGRSHTPHAAPAVA